MRILGIDPGSTLIGYGCIEDDGKGKTTLITSGVIKIKAKELPEKLKELGSRLEELLKETGPALVGIEKLFFSKNKKTALEVAHARGVILAELLRLNLPVREFTPGEVKSAVTGYGSADKIMVAKMVGKILGITELEGDDNTSDAIAVALTTAARERTHGSY